jgi:signal transduction histidine kinase
MDWQTVVASIASSGIVASGIGYMLKKTFDRTLELHFERISDQNKALIQEGMRRYAFIYDKQYEVLKLILSLTYRLRNLVRELSERVENMNQRENHELYERFQGYNNALVELLYEERAILPASIFRIAHELKTVLGGINSNLSFIDRRRHTGRITDEWLQAKYRDVRTDYKLIDGQYNQLVGQVQDAIGINEPKHDA